MTTRSMAQRRLPPLAREVINRLRADAADLPATAKRKGVTIDRWEQREEAKAARDHFDLGVWLYYYATRIGRRDALTERIDCARRIFMAGIVSPGYRFFTVFEFGERQFDTLFEMGDADAVIDALRELALTSRDPGLLRAFAEYGWSLERRQPDLFG